MTDIIQYFSNHHDQLFYLVAGVSFMVELSVLGLGGPLLFFAIASFLTGLCVSLGLISGWEAEGFVLGAFTLVITILFWKPLKRFQNSGGGTDTSSDMIGKQVISSAEITSQGGSIRYSGVAWTARLADNSTSDAIAEGTTCTIVAVDGNVMLVESA
jgi:membrane protein implicated in regulation of membrane protease activity